MYVSMREILGTGVQSMMVTNSSVPAWLFISSSCVCFCREGRGSRPAGQRAAGRQRALRRPGGDGEASRVQSANRRKSALLQLCQHAEACSGQCCVCVIGQIHQYRTVAAFLKILLN